MAVAFSIGKELVARRHERLHVIGVLGRLDVPLERVRELYKGEMRMDVPIGTSVYPTEIAPVKEEPQYGRDFLACFHFTPPVDITLARAYDGESSIVTYSLDDSRARQLIRDITRNIGFVPSPPTPDFVRRVEEGFEIERLIYYTLEAMAGMARASLESAFGAVHYSNFLHRYWGLSKEEGIRRASKRFGVTMH
ncbi:MAG: hypothetical protein HYW25_01595 [Candidatus Aenigmarchaeota archaeon]|nr:hypothetical protein [Candidatus Aenigmarchaeota archaeon]